MKEYIEYLKDNLMSVEKFAAGTIEYDTDVVRKKNDIQRKLMAASGDPMKWVEENAANFDKIVKVHQNLLHEYADDPEKTLEAIKSKLAEYNKDMPKAA